MPLYYVHVASNRRGRCIRATDFRSVRIDHWPYDLPKETGRTATITILFRDHTASGRYCYDQPVTVSFDYFVQFTGQCGHFDGLISPNSAPSRYSYSGSQSTGCVHLPLRFTRYPYGSSHVIRDALKKSVFFSFFS